MTWCEMVPRETRLWIAVAVLAAVPAALSVTPIPDPVASPVRSRDVSWTHLNAPRLTLSHLSGSRQLLTWVVAGLQELTCKFYELYGAARVFLCVWFASSLPAPAIRLSFFVSGLKCVCRSFSDQRRWLDGGGISEGPQRPGLPERALSLKGPTPLSRAACRAVHLTPSLFHQNTSVTRRSLSLISATASVF